MSGIEAGEAAVDVLDAVDEGLVARAGAGGVKLTGEGGLSPQGATPSRS
jgi:hypothetical protein